MGDERLKDRHGSDIDDKGPVKPDADTVVNGRIPAAAGGESPSEGHRAKDSSRQKRGESLRCQEFGEYRIREEVARGAMGIVYRAEQVRLGREVALKVLLTGEHASDAEVRRFTREAQALARLRHPNIVPIYDIGEVSGRHYFTMDFIRGQTLSQVLAERRLTVTEALNIIEQVADAVAAAHTRGVIHRDIKPSNIMLDSDGGVHIMDFGLAKSSGAESKHTRDGTTIGTPAYMPPEQARGELSRVDEHSDIYSMGAVLYEMLTGQPPFGGTNMLEIVLAVINEDPLRPRRVNPRLSRELETIIVKAMEKDPLRRYNTATELRDEIRRYQSGEPIRAQPPSFLYRSRKLLRKHWLVAVVPLAVLLIAAAAGAYILYYRKQVQTGLIEGSRAKWGPVLSCDFSAGSLSENWEPLHSSYLDTRLLPVSGRPVSVWQNGRELVTRALSYGSSRASLQFRIREPLGSRSIALGFYGDQLGGSGSRAERATGIFRISSDRLELAVTISPDVNGSKPTVVADRWVQELAPGRTYLATAERHGISLSFKLEEITSSGNRREVTSLKYAHPQISNFRFRNMRVVVRGDQDLLFPQQLVMERLFLPRRGSALSGADVMFHRGDYNGAVAEYQAILNPAAGTETSSTVRERAAAYYRMGLYYEIKDQLEEALNSFEQARLLPVEASTGDDLEAVHANALLREIAVATRSGRPERVFKLLPELEKLTDQELAGPWIWDMAKLAGVDLAIRQKQGVLASDMVSRFSYPRGSAVLGNMLRQVGVRLLAEDPGRLKPFLGVWLDRLKPASEPLFGWISLSAEAGDLDSCLELFRSGKDRLGAGNRELVFYAQDACRHFAQSGNYSAAGRIIAAAGAKGLKKAYVEVQQAANSDWAARAQALELLRLASTNWPGDREVGGLAVDLGRSFLERRLYSRLKDVDEAYHTAEFIDVYAAALQELRSPEILPRRALDLLVEARERFGPDNIELARVAAEIGADYADCRNEDDYKLVFEAYSAYPSRLHLENFLVALEALLARPRFDRAGEVFAFARARIGRNDQLEAVVCRMIDSTPPGEELLAFMDQVATVEPLLMGKPRKLAVWRLELARYYLLAGNELVASEVYKRVWDAGSKAPAELANEALLRHGLLRALGDNRGDSVQARKLLGRLANSGEEQTRPVFMARAVLNRELDPEAFRNEARSMKLSRAETELTLAASASLNSDANAKANFLRLALTAVGSGPDRYHWPYEIIKFTNEDVLRSHG